jgi:diaminohydroxyphosphoribosylaminopyrimidine deaminase / 5-amino-6-(5-phosphoribosylamino)uracil reductase
MRLPPCSRLAQTAREAPVLLFTSSDADSGQQLKELGVELVKRSAGTRDLAAVLDELGKRELQTVLLEGGGTVAGAFLDARLVNKVTFFIAPMIIGGREATIAVAGTGAERIADAFQLDNVEVVQRGRDVEVTGYPFKSKDEG